jgi:hypothetical protein
MAKQKTDSLSGKVGKAITGTFSLDKFKAGKNLGQSSSNFKPQAWIKFTEPVSEMLEMPGMPKGKVRSRIIMTPENAKRLMKALIDNVQKYEQNFGAINDGDLPNMPPMNFGTPNTMA